MATILSIETSTDVCSVALSTDGFTLCHREDFNGPNHAAVISDFIKDCLAEKERNNFAEIDAVAVSMGPGSYTGLRIGLSEAKGLAFGLGKPLIGINTLKLLAAEAMFSFTEFDPDTDIIIPMIDARRDEVYTASFNGALEEVENSRPLIITPDSFSNGFEGKKLVFCGNGAEKAHRILEKRGQEMIFMPDLKPLAVYMMPLAEMAYMKKDFIDLAYSVPFYLKDFQATTPKRRI